jgi:hypothetical protein
MKPILIAALLFSNIAYGQLNPDNNTSGNNVSKRHMQQRQHQHQQQQQIIQKQQYEQKAEPQQVQELKRQHQDSMLELQKSNTKYNGINQ